MSLFLHDVTLLRPFREVEMTHMALVNKCRKTSILNYLHVSPQQKDMYRGKQRTSKNCHDTTEQHLGLPSTGLGRGSHMHHSGAHPNRKLEQQADPTKEARRETDPKQDSL